MIRSCGALVLVVVNLSVNCAWVQVKRVIQEPQDFGQGL